MAAALKLTTRNLTKPFWTGFRALSSTGASICVGLGKAGVNVGLLNIPMQHDSTKERFTISCLGVGASVGLSPFPVTIDFAPEHLPSSGIGTVFAMMGTKRPFISSMLDGVVLVATAAQSAGAGSSVSVVVWLQSTTALIDPNPAAGRYTNIVAFCILAGGQYGAPSIGYSNMIMRARVVRAGRSVSGLG